MEELKPQKIKAAIAYFEDAVKESDEIISDCTPALQAEFTEQKQHFVVALEALRRAAPENTSEIVKKLWALYDKFEDPEHVVCGDAAKLLQAAPENKPDPAGLHVKYDVRKVSDGSVVNNCFVLRPDRDPAAVAALRTYAGATENKALSEDIFGWVGYPKNKALTQEQQDADELIRMLIADKNVSPCEWCRTPDKGGETCKGCFLYEDSNECPSKFTAFSAKSSNEPLTLEQLRKMDGEPVYNVTNTELGSFWALVEKVYADKVKLVTTDTGHILLLHLDAVKSGSVKLYVRKPEGSAP